MIYLENADYFVRLVDLPYGVGGCVTPNDDGTFSVYINARCSTGKQRESYKHELRHIERNDFYNGMPIEQIEDL